DLHLTSPGGAQRRNRFWRQYQYRDDDPDNRERKSSRCYGALDRRRDQFRIPNDTNQGDQQQSETRQGRTSGRPNRVVVRLDNLAIATYGQKVVAVSTCLERHEESV